MTARRRRRPVIKVDSDGVRARTVEELLDAGTIARHLERHEQSDDRLEGSCRQLHYLAACERDRLVRERGLEPAVGWPVFAERPEACRTRCPAALRFCR